VAAVARGADAVISSAFSSLATLMGPNQVIQQPSGYVAELHPDDAERGQKQRLALLDGDRTIERCGEESLDHAIGLDPVVRSCKHEEVLERDSAPLSRYYANLLLDIL